MRSSPAWPDFVSELQRQDTSLVDIGPFAHAGLNSYLAMGRLLSSKGLPTPDAASFASLPSLLASCRPKYATSGLKSLQSIPDKSIDYVWSHTVLQHIRKSDFAETMRQLRRILTSDGIMSHIIDLRDMLGGALNHLRFRESVWESSFMAASGFYSNRIRYGEMLSLFRQAGFDVEILKVERWDRIPTPRSRLVNTFRDLPEDDIRVRSFDAVLRPA
jgi:SAM-dependent methyltransferase